MLHTLDKYLGMLEEGITAIAYFTMTLVVLWAVLCRYVLQIPFVYGDEAARYLMIYSVFIGISIGARKGVHLGVEAFVEMLPPRPRRAMKLAALAFTAVLYFALAWVTLVMTMRIYATGQHSSSLHIPMWAVYMSMPIGLSLSGIRSIQALWAMLQRRAAFEESVEQFT